MLKTLKLQLKRWLRKPLVSKRYIVKLVETTKPFPKTSYYICEYGAILHETPDINKATIFEYEESAHSIADFVNETYDFKATVMFHSYNVC